ncbi:MAG: hypothetical protein KDA92_12815 [Planctomycetales bacterium]|nr:hypothetical protein [Planctomycetales bacterium]
MASYHPSVLRRYFAGIAENTFQTQLGVADPPLIDYIADLLTRFIRSEAIFRIRSLAGRPIREVGEMLVEAQARVGTAKRDVHRHIGDYTLFWTGVYPEALQRMKSSRDQLVDYGAEGKRSYWIASTIESETPEAAASEILERLSRQFDLCAYGLREVRRVWEEREGEDPEQTFLIC